MVNLSELQISSWAPQILQGSMKGIRVVHQPSCTVVTCCQYRSQERNRAVALKEIQCEIEDKEFFG